MEKSALDLLLANDIPEPKIKKYRHKRLSKEFGSDFILTLRQLSYQTVAEVRKRTDDTDAHTVLAAVIDPDLKSRELMDKYRASTPAELIKLLFLPGEISDIAREAEKHSGYRVATLEEYEEFKKK